MSEPPDLQLIVRWDTPTGGKIVCFADSASGLWNAITMCMNAGAQTVTVTVERIEPKKEPL